MIPSSSPSFFFLLFLLFFPLSPSPSLLSFFPSVERDIDTKTDIGTPIEFMIGVYMYSEHMDRIVILG